MSERIVIDPEQLRRLASRMKGATLLLSSTTRDLASRALPSMPPSVASLVSDSMARVNAEVQDLAAGLTREAGGLLARATWAELGQGDPAGWMSGGVEARAAGHGGGPDPVGVLPPFSEAQLERAQQWAVDEIADDDTLGDVGESDEAELRDLVGRDLTEAQQIVAEDLHQLSYISHGMPEIGDVLWGPDATSEAIAEGALGTALDHLSDEPTGIGIIGCIAVGGGLDLPDEPGVRP